MDAPGEIQLNSPEYPGNVESLILTLQEVLRKFGNLDVVTEHHAFAREPLEIEVSDGEGTIRPPLLIFR